MNSDEFIGVGTEDGTLVPQEWPLLLDFPQAFIAYARRFAGHEIVVTIRRRRSKRSDRQNRALHAALSGWVLWLQQTTPDAPDVEQLKDDLLALRWGYIVRQSLLTGEIVRALVKPHTSTLNTAEFAELFDLAVVEAAKTGYVMELPSEFIERKKKEARQQKRTRAKTGSAAA